MISYVRLVRLGYTPTLCREFLPHYSFRTVDFCEMQAWDIDLLNRWMIQLRFAL